MSKKDMKRLLIVLLTMLLLAGCSAPVEAPAAGVAASEATGAIETTTFPVPFGETLRLDLLGDGVEDTLQIHSAYPLGEGETDTYAPHLTWKVEGETWASLEIFGSYPGSNAPEILECITDSERQTTYTLLGQYEEIFQDYIACEIYRFFGATLRRIALPKPEEALYTSEKGIELLREICPAFCPAESERLLRVGWRGPYALDLGEDGLTCSLALYFLDPEYGQYEEYTATLLMGEEGWTLLDYTSAWQSMGFGSMQPVKELFDFAGEPIPTPMSFPSKSWASLHRSYATYIVQWPAFYESGYTRWGGVGSLADLLDSPYNKPILGDAATIQSRLSAPLAKNDRFLVYPVIERYEVTRVHTEGYGVYILDKAGEASRLAQFVAEEYGLTISNFAGTDAYCLTMSKRPLSTCRYDPECKYALRNPGGLDDEHCFPMGRSSFLAPEGSLFHLEDPEIMMASYAVQAKDLEGDGTLEYIIASVGKGGYLYAMDLREDGGYEAILPAWSGHESALSIALQEFHDADPDVIYRVLIPIWDDYPWG